MVFSKVENYIVDHILEHFDYLKFRTLNQISVTCTVSQTGYQTGNAITPFLKKELTPVLEKISKEETNFTYLHCVEYHAGDYQGMHDHMASDKYSFIIYLNDTDGDTVFQYPNNEIVRVTPEKGKIVVFNSDILHGSEPTTGLRLIAAGRSE